MPDEATGTGGLTLTGLARQWRGEADVHDPGEITLFGDLDAVERRAYSKALRDCAKELESIAADRAIVSRVDLEIALTLIALHVPPDFRPSVIVDRLSAAVKAEVATDA